MQFQEFCKQQITHQYIFAAEKAALAALYTKDIWNGSKIYSKGRGHKISSLFYMLILPLTLSILSNGWGVPIVRNRVIHSVQREITPG